jgi:predicted aldo/keto reductase-like oxidoreductase
MDEIIVTVRDLAVEYSLQLVPLEGLMIASASVCRLAAIAQDGVHPTPRGHEVIAQSWIQTFSNTAVWSSADGKKLGGTLLSHLGSEIKKLGFGLMRLPAVDGNIDIEQTKQMVDAFMDKGFTYFDTAYGYYHGKSEEAARIALVDRYPRESFQLATKLPAWGGAATVQEAQDMFWTSLKRCGVEYFDCYLLHNLGAERTALFDKFGVWEFLAQQKQEGRIKYLGFSMHATADTLEALLLAHPDMDFVQLQINYADWESSIIQSRKCY